MALPIAILFVLVAMIAAGHLLVRRAYGRLPNVTPYVIPWRSLVVRWLACVALLFVAERIMPGGALAVLLISPVVVLQWWRGVRKTLRLVGALDDACRHGDDTKIEALLELRTPPRRPRAYNAWAAYILVAASRAHALQQTERGSAWLSAVDPERVRPQTRLYLLQARSAFALSLGQREEARTLLQLVPASVKPSTLQESFVILRALLAAIDGDDSEARLREVQAARARATGFAFDGWTAVEVHVRAARSDEAGASDLLRDMLKRDNSAGVARLARHGGPGSALAARVLGGEPYR